MTLSKRALVTGPLALGALALMVGALVLDSGSFEAARPPGVIDASEYERVAERAFDGHGRVSLGRDFRREAMGAGVTVVAWNARVAIADVQRDEILAACAERGDLRVTATNERGVFRFPDLEPGVDWSSLALAADAATAALEPRPLVPGVACEHVLMATDVRATCFVDGEGNALAIDRLLGNDAGLGVPFARAYCGTGTARPGLELPRTPERDFVLAYHGLAELIGLPTDEGLLFVRQSWNHGGIYETAIENLAPRFEWVVPDGPEFDGFESTAAPATWRPIDRAHGESEVVERVVVEPLGFEAALRLVVPSDLTSRFALATELVLEFEDVAGTSERPGRYGPAFVLDLANLATEEEIAGRELLVESLPRGTYDVRAVARRGRSFEAMPDGRPWITVAPTRVELAPDEVSMLAVALEAAPATIHLDFPASVAPYVDLIAVSLQDFASGRSLHRYVDPRDHALRGVPPGRWTIFLDTWGRDFAPPTDERRTWIDLPDQRRTADRVRAYASERESIEVAVHELMDNTLVGDPSRFADAFTVDLEPGEQLTLRVGRER